MVETQVECDFSLIVTMIDGFLVDLGTQSLIDGDKARDQLLDLRPLCQSMQFEEIVSE